MWLFSYPKFQVVFVHILDEFSWPVAETGSHCLK